MISSDVLEIIGPFNLWRNDIFTGISRPAYIGHIIKMLEAPGTIVSVTGVRRAGKTVIARQVLKELTDSIDKTQTLLVNFEDPSLEPYLNVAGLDTILDSYRHFINPERTAYAVLDEISRVKGWERWVRRKLELNEDLKIIVTGSSSKLMEDDMASVLTGRYISVKVSPLSLNEYRDFVVDHPDDLRTLKDYLTTGGMPTAVLTKDVQVRKEYLKDLFDSILLKDVAIKHGIRNTSDLRSLAVLLLSSLTSPTSARKLHNVLKGMGHDTAASTVNQYMDHLAEALLFHFVKVFSYKVKDQLQYPKMVYCVDNGLAEAVSFKMSSNWGQMAENIVAVELIRRYGPENVFYWRCESGRDVDFVILEDLNVKQLIEVCWDLSDEKTQQRELTSLSEAKEESGCDDVVLITNTSQVEVPDWVQVRRLEKWLRGA